MKKAYLAYKAWYMEWIYHSLDHERFSGMSKEQVFADHLEELGLYGLMEKLCEWDENE